jgi:hypothetical protein
MYASLALQMWALQDRDLFEAENSLGAFLLDLPESLGHRR